MLHLIDGNKDDKILGAGPEDGNTFNRPRRLLILLILFTGSKNLLYVPNFEPLILFAHWLDLINEDILLPEDTVPSLSRPDICASCLRSHGFTSGGRVRERCAYCFNKLQYLQRFYFDPWPGRIAHLLGISKEETEAHTADALYYHMVARGNTALRSLRDLNAQSAEEEYHGPQV